MTDEALLAAALEIPDPAARAAYLDAVCAGDPGRRARVEGLLAARVSTGVFAAPPTDPHATTARSSDSPDPDATRPSGDNRPAAAHDDLPDLLAPPTRPGELGRLDHYSVLAVLGRGGFGVVLKAFDERLHRIVAVKVLVPPFSDSGPARARFLGEARAAAAVRDDHVVGVFAVSDDDAPHPYFVMEFVAGWTLQHRIERAGARPPGEAVRVGTEVARGLAAAHARGLIHRDIKPANVLLEEGDGRAKVSDFGLARAADELAAAATVGVTGTPAYMSPEQARGEPLDHRSDLFSLGGVLYAMCTGGPPFRAGTAAAVLELVVRCAPRPVREVNPRVPPWLAAVVARLLAPNPVDRFQSAREVVTALTAGPAALGPAADHWRPEWRTPAAAPRASRSKSWLAPVTVVALLAVVVGVSQFMVFRDGRSGAGVNVAVNAPPNTDPPPALKKTPLPKAAPPPKEFSPLPAPPKTFPPVTAVKPAPGPPDEPAPPAPVSSAAAGLREVMTALRAYDKTHDRLPPAAIVGEDGAPLLSWRVAILPQLGRDALYKQFRLDSPWDSPHNKKLIPLMPKAFQGSLAANDGKTAFRVFVGGRAAFDPALKARLSLIPDGATNTFGVVESGDPVEWTRPDDIPFDGKTAPRLAPPGGGRVVVVVMLDGTVRRINPTLTAPDVIRRAIDTADGEPVPFP